MALEIVTTVCDLCGAEESSDIRTIEAHTIRVDRRTVELDACAQCWAPIGDALGAALGAGRRVKKTA